MKHARALSGLLILALLCWLGYAWFFPPDAVLIERRIHRLVALFPVEKQESIFVQALRADQIAEYFSYDVSLDLGDISRSSQDIHSRLELRQTVAAARNRFSGLRLEIPSLQVKVNEDAQNADVRMGVLIWKGEDPTPLAEEVRLTLRKEHGTWLIAVVEGVRETTLPVAVR